MPPLLPSPFRGLRVLQGASGPGARGCPRCCLESGGVRCACREEGKWGGGGEQLPATPSAPARALAPRTSRPPGKGGWAPRLFSIFLLWAQAAAARVQPQRVRAPCSLGDHLPNSYTLFITCTPPHSFPAPPFLLWIRPELPSPRDQSLTSAHAHLWLWSLFRAFRPSFPRGRAELGRVVARRRAQPPCFQPLRGAALAVGETFCVCLKLGANYQYLKIYIQLLK